MWQKMDKDFVLLWTRMRIMCSEERDIQYTFFVEQHSQNNSRDFVKEFVIEVKSPFTMGKKYKLCEKRALESFEYFAC